MPRHRLTPGQSLVGAVSARTTNDTIGVLEYADRHGLWTPQRPEVIRRQPQATIFLGRNDTGATLSIGDVVSLAGLGVDASNYYGEFKREITFALGSVTASTNGKFGVCTQPIEAGAFGPVAVSGVCVCKVDIDDAGHEYANTTDGESYLTSAADSGDAVIIWQPGSTGVQECLVRIDSVGGGAGASWPLVRLYSGSWKSQYSTTTYLLNGYPADCKFTYYNGDASACGITITGDGASAYNTPLLTFNASGGEYLIIPNIVGEINDSGVSYTQTVTTGAASAGTAHTHDVDCPIRQFAFLSAQLFKRASGATLWGAAKAVSIGSTALMKGNVYNSAANGNSISCSPMYIRDITAGDELLLRCFAYHTPSSGTVYFTYSIVELTIIRVLEDDTQSTVT